MTAPKQQSTGSADEAKRGAEARDWSWVEASVWTERMVSALVNGVKACPRAGRSPDPWADDFVVLCSSREEAEAALAEIHRWVADNGLRPHPDKTHLGDCRRPGEGFEFLGYRFEAGRRLVRGKSLTRLKDGIRARTQRTRGASLARIVADLNPMLKGWHGYFQHAHPNTFSDMDGFVRRRPRAIPRKQRKRRGLGRSETDHRRWPNALFADAGLFALSPAWHAARHPR